MEEAAVNVWMVRLEGDLLVVLGVGSKQGEK
jgi:hypothetical protein